MSVTAESRVTVPDIGDFDAVPVIEILVAVGDAVSAEDPLVTLESDKATMDVPAPFDGVVREIGVAVGDSVSQGSDLMTIEPTEDGADGDSQGDPPEPQLASEPAQTSQSAPPSSGQAPHNGDGPAAAAGDTPSGVPGGRIYASPSVRRLARELDVDLRGAEGSGRKGRLTADDVRAIADSPVGARGGSLAPVTRSGASSESQAGSGGGLELLPWPKVDFKKFGEIERVPRTRIQRISAPNLARNWVMIPHVTHNDEADITELEAWRKELNAQYRGEVKFTMVAFLVKACVAALQAFPDVNASLDGDELVRKRYWNIGFAADTPGGLVVPVIRDADRKGLAEIAGDLTELSGRAREGKLAPGDMSGATFTISSLGGIGGTSFTPIINAPEVAILGVTRAAMKPVWDGSAFAPRLMVPLSFSYDHRVVDGAAAARFTAFLAEVLSDLRRVLL
jgi:pyruvate dehydrogenase E2 component (dihydrolipoamide acetyltransferase)